MVTWRSVSIILKIFAAFILGCAGALTALGASEESRNPAHQVDVPITDWGNDTKLLGNYIVLGMEAVFCIVALALALMLLCKRFPRPSYVEFVPLVMGTVLLLLSFGVEAWYSSCYDGDAADAAEAQGDVCIVQGWVSASVCICAATILYGADAFIWYFCRKRCVTWVGWYYQDNNWEIYPNQEKENLPENEETPEDDDPPPYDDDAMEPDGMTDVEV